MSIDLSGEWKIRLERDIYEETEPVPAEGTIHLPGSLQAAGYGYPVTWRTEWVSGLHNPFWYEREEYSHGGISDGQAPYGQKECMVSFLAQPVRHFTGVAWYERSFVVEQPDTEWLLFLELTRWKVSAYIDDVYMGEFISLCVPARIPCGRLQTGEHRLRIGVDNGMQYPYRPDGHGVSDALGATWNGIAGEILLLSCEEAEERRRQRTAYAEAHPRRVEVREGRFFVDGKPEYFRGTHFGGDYPLTGYPAAHRAWWDKLMETVKSYGMNFIRCHSYCPPEAAFAAADEAGVYLQPECGMWNYFKEGIPMLEVLYRETENILRQFGHHPSFVLFSPSNEPGGRWYQVLREWVQFARETDRKLGYEGRRIYTAQSGWPYDVPPGEVEGTDYLYFHRSGYGPFAGGTIRNSPGWRGRDYNPSLEGCRLPVICHEMGQWCAYPDFDVMEKFKGYLVPGNYKVIQENARAMGVLSLDKDFAYCSGRNQVRLYKEDLEANFRTEQLYGFEMLDLHDYMGQGMALVGVLDAFWESKGYVMPEEFREFCGETVILARLSSYVWRRQDTLEASVEICHFGDGKLEGKEVVWRLYDAQTGRSEASGSFQCPRILRGSKITVGAISQPLTEVRGNRHCVLELALEGIRNHYDIYIYDACACMPEEDPIRKDACTGEKAPAEAAVLYTRDWQEAKPALEKGYTVIYSPWLSDLDYDCPPLSMKNVFWNAQMGPGWIRPLGLSIQEGHPLFQNFPAEHDGGWQWEDILEHGRGFCLDGMPESVVPVVRAIDDWNRNLPLSLILEVKVGRGRLLLVSADLEGSFQERPAAYSLKQALLKYGASGQYAEAHEAEPEAVERHLFPLLQSERLIKEPALQCNPNNTFRLEGEQFPLCIDIALREKRAVEGIYYLPVQKDRMFEGCIRDYTVECLTEAGWKVCAQGTFTNGLRAQKALFKEKALTDSIRLNVMSCYGTGERTRWKAADSGWHRSLEKPKPLVQLAGLHIICEGDAPHNDELFWMENQRSSTKEIEN